MKLKNAHGSVRLYVRHERSCSHADPDYQKCKCAKWLAVHQRGGEPHRYSLNTPSWTEGVQLATDKLRSLDPEIAAARERVAAATAAERTSKTVLEAINLWLERTRRQFGKDAAILKQYRSTFGWTDRDGETHGSLLGFVEEYNQDHPNEPILTIEEPWQVVQSKFSGSFAGGKL